jgi:hypothetical protein
MDRYWHEFLVWCTKAPEGKAHELVFWLDHRYPTEENFWEYMVNVRGEELNTKVAQP